MSIRLIILIIGILIFAVAGGVKFSDYQKQLDLAAEMVRLKSGIEEADRTNDPEIAIEAYTRLQALIQNVQYNILRRQYELVTRSLTGIRKSRENKYLAADVSDQFNRLNKFLREMNPRFEQVIGNKQPVDPEIQWQVYNLRGAVRLIEAYCIVENENNFKKATALMKAAIADFKTAIIIVDKLPAKPDQRNIPRWNMEILKGEQYMKMISSTRLAAEHRLNIKENLEAIIPERGGYAPGEPVDMRIEK